MTQLRADVRTLLNEHGYDVTFRRVTEGSYDPATGTTGASSTADETARVVFLSYNDGEIDGSEIQRGDRKAVISAVDASGSALVKVPQNNDKLIGEGDTVSVVSVQTIKSGATVIAYICQVRD